MAEDSDLEKTEDATDRRIERARESGQIAHSKELSTFAVLMASVLMLGYLGDSFYEAMRHLMASSFTFTTADLLNPDIPIQRLFKASLDILIVFLPFFVVIAVVGIACHILIGGWLFSTDVLTPKLSKLNPINGMGRIISMQGLVEMIKAIIKAFLIGGVAVWVMLKEKGEILGLISEPLESGIFHLAHIVEHTLIWIISSLLVLVLIDVPWQLFSYHKSLRMTKEEVKQEAKEAEGDPKIKGRIRQLQFEAARKRMMSAVPKADVIVTNPTHYAVAIQYNQATMKAPKVIAKGAFRMAEQIIASGQEHRITILRTPPLARALYFHAPLDKEIPVALFQATAEVLAYLYQLRLFENSGGIAPQIPENLPVPPELDPGEKAENIPDTPDLSPELR